MSGAVPALAVHRLEAGYAGTVVLRDVSLVVPAGAVVALLGPNGAGKSTLLRAVCGLLPARAGRVELHGRDVTRERAHQRAAAGLCHVPEGRGIFPGLSVRENVLLQSPRGRQREALERATTAFPILGKRLRQRAGTLSGGEQQMLALAAAHVREPSLVLVDEASLGLAPIVVDEIFRFLRERAAEGTAILLVDQYATRALELASVAYVLRRGQVAFQGVASDLGGSDLFARYLGIDGDAAPAEGAAPEGEAARGG
jgi:branched-chain amino acid transport system ATP-binding protein